MSNGYMTYRTALVQDVCTWMSKCCDADPKQRVRTADLSRSYMDWAAGAGGAAISQRMLVEVLKQLGYGLMRTARDRYVVGLALKPITAPAWPAPPAALLGDDLPAGIPTP